MKQFLKTLQQMQPRQWLALSGAIIFMWSIMVPLHRVLWTSHRYELSQEVRGLLGNQSVDYAHLMKLEDGVYRFNPDATQDTAAPASPSVAMGREGGDSKDTMPAYDLATDPKKGVTIYDPASKLNFSLIPDFKLMTGQQIDDHVVYPLKGLKGQAIYSPKANGLKEDIVLHEEQGDALNFTYSLNLPDSLEARQQDDGSIAIYSGDPSLFGNISFGSDADRTKVELARKNAVKNNLVFTIPAPVIVQQNGDLPNETRADFVLKNNKVTVEARGLKKLNYPISIDPTVVVNSTSTFTDGNLEDNIEVDSGNNQIKRAGLSGGTVGTWNSTNTFATNRSGQATIAYNGYMYILGGHSGSAYLGDVQYAPINSNGTLGAWSSTTSLPGLRFAGAAVAYNGYVYFSGGHDGSALHDETYYAKINANGTLGSWNLGNYFSTARYGLTAQAYNGYLYISGGNKSASNTTCRASGSGFSCSDVQYAAFRGDGSIGGWATASTYYSSPRFKAGMTAYNGYLYVAGGLGESGVLNDVQYAALASDGSVGTWAATTSFTTARYTPVLVAANGYLYMMSGADAANSTHYNDVQYASINLNGTVGPWSTTTSFGTAARYVGAVVYKGYLYKLGGMNAASGFSEPVVYARIDSPGTLGNFKTTTSLAAGRSNHGTVAYGGYLYVLGGWTTTYSNDVYYAAINSDGTLGSWNATTSFTTAVYAGAAVAYNGYMYIGGGQSSGGFTTDVQYAPINTNGTLGSWTTTSSFSGGRRVLAMTTYNGYIYVSGGGTAGPDFNAVQYAPINANGSVGTWATTTSFTTARWAHAMVPYAGRMYIYGGGAVNSGPGLSDVQFATINSNGTLSSWTTTSSMGTLRSGLAGVAANGYLYAYGGITNSTYYNTSEYAKINNDGTIGSWTATASFTTARYGHGGVAYNGYLYSVGGYSGSYQSDVQYAAINNGGPGATGTWGGAGNSFANDRYAQASVALNGYLYVMGGYNLLSGSQTFNYTGGTQTYTVPAGVTSVTVETWGAQGGSGGAGGYAKGTITTTPSESLTVYVGGAGAGPSGRSGGAGGWPSGGAGASVTGSDFGYGGAGGAGGGGYSAVLRGGTWLMAGGGGGGAGGTTYTGQAGGGGGSGGGTGGGTGASANGHSGWEGTNATGGVGGTAGTTGGPGSAGAGGTGVAGGTSGTAGSAGSGTSGGAGGSFTGNSLGASGGGGGGGYYGGGGGGGGAHNGCCGIYSGAGGGGGGANYITGTSTVSTNGVKSGNGQVTISYNSATYYNDVQYAAINANGTIGAFTTASNALWSGRYGHRAVAANGYIYVIAGSNGSNLNEVWYAKQGSSGALASDAGCGAQWCSSTAFTTGRTLPAVAVYNDRLYIAGGYNGSALSDVQYASLNASTGAVGSWSSTTSLPSGRNSAAAVAYNGYLYITGGHDGTNYLNTVNYALINSNGTIGSWSATTGFNNARYTHGAVAYNGYMYIYGGAASPLYDDVQYAPILANGHVGSWNQSGKFNDTRAYLSSVMYNGYIYAVGGCANSGCTTVKVNTQYAPLQSIPRKARYSKYVDLGSLIAPTKVTMRFSGTASGAYAYGNSTSGGSTSYGTLSSLSSSSGAFQNALSGYTQYVWLRMTMDDGEQAVFGDDNQTSVSGFEMYYSPVSSGSIQPRLRGGKMVQENNITGLDAQPN